jgi:hypothetical protein
VAKLIYIRKIKLSLENGKNRPYRVINFKDRRPGLKIANEN